MFFHTEIWANLKDRLKRVIQQREKAGQYRSKSTKGTSICRITRPHGCRTKAASLFRCFSKWWERVGFSRLELITFSFLGPLCIYSIPVYLTGYHKNTQQRPNLVFHQSNWRVKSQFPSDQWFSCSPRVKQEVPTHLNVWNVFSAFIPSL